MRCDTRAYLQLMNDREEAVRESYREENHVEFLLQQLLYFRFGKEIRTEVGS